MVSVPRAREKGAAIDPFEDFEGCFVVFNAAEPVVGHREWLATRANAIAPDRIGLVKDTPMVRWAISCRPLRTVPTYWRERVRSWQMAVWLWTVSVENLV